MTPARRGRRSHRDEGDDASGILSGREGGGGRRSVDAMLPGQEGSGVRLHKGSDNQLDGKVEDDAVTTAAGMSSRGGGRWTTRLLGGGG